MFSHIHTPRIVKTHFANELIIIIIIAEMKGGIFSCEVVESVLARLIRLPLLEWFSLRLSKIQDQSNNYCNQSQQKQTAS